MYILCPYASPIFHCICNAQLWKWMSLCYDIFGIFNAYSEVARGVSTVNTEQSVLQTGSYTVYYPAWMSTNKSVWIVTSREEEGEPGTCSLLYGKLEYLIPSPPHSVSLYLKIMQLSLFWRYRVCVYKVTTPWVGTGWEEFPVSTILIGHTLDLTCLLGGLILYIVCCPVLGLVSWIDVLSPLICAVFSLLFYP